jgi:hypothetical protein
MFTKPANFQPATSPAPGHRDAHQPQAALAQTALARAAAAASGLTTGVNARPILRRAALAAAGTGAAAAMALGSSVPSFAATIPIVNTTDQAGYQAGNNAWRFRYVQAEMFLPHPGSPQHGCPIDASNPNHLESSLQLIGAPSGPNAAIGVRCLHTSVGNIYTLGWARGYSGNKHPALDHPGPRVLPGDIIMLKLYYDTGKHTMRFTACHAVGGPPDCGTYTDPADLLDITVGVPPTDYKQAVVSANVANPLPHPPAPGTSQILAPFKEAAVTTYNGIHGTGINGPWGVQQEIERQLAFGGNLIAAPTGLTTVRPPGHVATSEFDINMFGEPPIGP